MGSTSQTLTMKILAKFCLLLVSYLVTLTGVEGLQCHYCGVKDLCEVPYYEDEAEFITCPVSCMTFQGFSKSGQKIIVRDCGFFEADECTANKIYENTDAKGTLCHCLSDECNSAEKMSSLSTLIILAICLLTI